MHGIEISKPSVSWTLASTALHMCQTLGFHRLSSMEQDPPSLQQHKQVLFWSVYTIISHVSLRLGRASVIQDCEISIPMPEDIFTGKGSWGLICVIWAKQGMIQNQVYVHLYSPAALNQPESERVSHARRLAGKLVSDIIEPFEVCLFLPEAVLATVCLTFLACCINGERFLRPGPYLYPDR